MRLLLAACLAAFLTNAAPSQAAESPAAESLAAESLAASGQAGDVSAYGRLAATLEELITVKAHLDGLLHQR